MKLATVNKMTERGQKAKLQLTYSCACSVAEVLYSEKFSGAKQYIYEDQRRPFDMAKEKTTEAYKWNNNITENFNKKKLLSV